MSSSAAVTVVSNTAYNRNEVKTGIVHFGVGRFHRAHEALYVHEILNSGSEGLDWGICGINILSFDATMHGKLAAQKGAYHLIERNGNDSVVKRIDSIVEMIYGYEDPEAVFAKLARPEVKIVTFTVTEAGYFFDPSTRTLDTSNVNVKHDIENPMKPPKTLVGYLSRGLLSRFQANMQPFTVQCCDNIQGNGDLVRSLVLEHCKLAYGGGSGDGDGSEAAFVQWVAASVAFPNSMVDRIAPAPTAQEGEFIQQHDIRVIHSDAGAGAGELDAAPVTSEGYRQWVIEDKYCNDRPRWEHFGVQLVPSVKPYEKIKVRLLNGGHVALGYAGHLAGFQLVDQTATDPLFQAFLRGFFSEVQQTLLPVEGVDIAQYQDTLVTRFANAAIADQIPRICKDGSAKIPGFIMASCGELLEAGKTYKCVAFVLASYMRYVTRLTEEGVALDDPEAAKLASLAQRSAGKADVFLSEQSLFGAVGGNTGLVGAVQEGYDAIVREGVVGAMRGVLQ